MALPLSTATYWGLRLRIKTFYFCYCCGVFQSLKSVDNIFVCAIMRTKYQVQEMGRFMALHTGILSQISAPKSA